MATDPNNPFGHLLAPAPAPQPVAAPAPRAPAAPGPQLVVPRGVAPTETPEFRAAVAGAETAAREAAQAQAERAKKEKTPEQLAAESVNLDGFRRTVRRAIGETNALSAGFGSFTSGIPYAPAQSLASDLETIKANIGLNSLLQLKESGGTLGQVAVFELQTLQNSLANLDPSLPPDRLKSNLREVEFRSVNVERAIRGLEPFKNKTEYYKDLNRRKQTELKDIEQAAPEAEIATGKFRTEVDPARRGLDSKIRARIGAGQTTDEIVSYLDSVVPSLGQSLSTQIDAAVKFRQQYPDVPLSKYPIDVERVQVPTTPAQQALGAALRSPLGAGFLSAAESLTAGGLSAMQDNPALARAAFRGAAEESPVSSFIGDVVGGGLAMLPMARGLQGLGAGARLANIGAGTIYGGTRGGLTGESDTASNIATGATGGLIGGIIGEKAAGAVSRVLSPQIDNAVRLLADKDVPLTLGQMLGGVAKDFEDKLQSVPLAGFVISEGRRRGLDRAQRAVVDEALDPIGVKLPKDVEVGTDAMKYMQTAFNDAYDEVRSRMSARFDRELRDGLTNIVSSAKAGGELTDAQAEQLNRIVQSRIVSRFRKNQNQLDGDLYKRTSSELKKLARENYGTPLGSRINDVRALLDESAARFSRPEDVARLADIDRGYAKSVIIENAAKMRAGQAGTFSPSQLESAVQRGDLSARNRAFLRGEAQLQETAGAMRQVLPTAVADSGTAGREAVVGGNVGILSKIASPIFAGGATEPGQALTRWLLLNRPDLARQLGATVGSEQARAAARAAGTVGGIDILGTEY
jgi:hypothetical protein